MKIVCVWSVSMFKSLSSLKIKQTIQQQHIKSQARRSNEVVRRHHCETKFL